MLPTRPESEEVEETSDDDTKCYHLASTHLQKLMLMKVVILSSTYDVPYRTVLRRIGAGVRDSSRLTYIQTLEQF